MNWRPRRRLILGGVLIVASLSLLFGYRILVSSPLGDILPMSGSVEKHLYSQSELESVYGINQDVEVSVYLPPDYDGTRPLPVIYLLDADSLFRGTAGLLSAMIAEDPGRAAILVGVGYGYANPYYASLGMGRWRDYAIPGDPQFKENPNAPGFLRFLADELVPFVSAQYTVDTSRSALFGHSMGGDFAFYAFLSIDPASGSNPFNYFVIADGGNEPHFPARFMPDFEQKLAANGGAVHDKLHVYFIWGGDVGEPGALEHIETLYQWLEGLQAPDIYGYRYFPTGLDHGETMRTMAVEGLNLLLAPERRADYSDSHSQKVEAGDRDV